VIGQVRALDVVRARKHLEMNTGGLDMRKGHHPKTTLSYTRFSIVFL